MIPWPAKIAAKLALSGLPFGYGVWQKLGLFRHGKMDELSYVMRVFSSHVEAAFPNGAHKGFSALELGTGDSIASALVAAAYGAEQTKLVDVGAFAATDTQLYKRIAPCEAIPPGPPRRSPHSQFPRSVGSQGLPCR